MKFGVRGFVLSICVVAVTLLGGAGGSSASTVTKCSTPAPSGRLFCVTVEDIDGVSPSGHVGSGARQADVQAYQFYKVTIANTSGSNLTNGTLSLVLTDNVGTSAGVTSTAVYIPSSATPFCSVASTDPNRVTCHLANLGAGSSTPTIPNGANPATLSFVENTSLEPDPEASVAWSPSAQDVQLSTSPTFDNQFTTLGYSVPAAKAAFTASLSESSGQACAPGLSCFGELVTTNLSAAEGGTFTTSNPFHLKLTVSLDLVPGGNTKAIVMSHQLEGGAFEVISRKCTSTPPTASEALPCITVTVDKKTKLLVVDAWGFQNGGWQPGL